MNYQNLLTAGLSLSITVLPAVASELPNIVVILVDDIGMENINCYYRQHKIETPNIDELASHSLQFMQHYSRSTVSAPSRCSLLTGNHTGNAYVRGNKGIRSTEVLFELHLPTQEVTVAELLKQKGYATMCVGKWGLGDPRTSGSPVKKSFDYFFGYLSQGNAHRYYPQYLYENEKKIELGGRVYSHWMILEKGLDFIRNQKKSERYFAYFMIIPSHADLDYPDISQYQGKIPETHYLNKNHKRGFKTQMSPKAAYASM